MIAGMGLTPGTRAFLDSVAEETWRASPPAAAAPYVPPPAAASTSTSLVRLPSLTTTQALPGAAAAAKRIPWAWVGVGAVALVGVVLLARRK